MQRSIRLVFSGLFVAVCLTVAALPAAAQGGQSNIVRVYSTEAKDVAQFEQGRVRHVEFHKKQGDAWTWYTWQVETGEDTGAYLTATFGHKWADFDAWDAKFAEADGVDAAKNLTPYTEESSNWFAVTLTEVSGTAGMSPEGPSSLTQLLHFNVRIGKEREFNNNLRKIHEAIQKTKWGGNNYVWYARADGGTLSEYVLAIPLKNWAEMEGPETPFPAMLEKAFGRTEAQATLDSFDSCVSRIWSEVLRYRKDLSHIPAAK